MSEAVPLDTSVRQASPRGRILVVDDEANARGALVQLLREEGYEVESAADGFKALGKLESFAPQLLLTDLKMPGMDGVELMAKLHQRLDRPVPVIIMTAFGTVESAVAALRAGAADYLTKPLHLEELLVVVERALERERLAEEVAGLRRRLAARARGGLVGQSRPMRRVYELIEQVAPSRASVLITGESGTGKELVAEAIHQNSDRAGGPFVKVHCGALAETLLESELFGHERGAFTGAVARRDGRFQIADGGTLFLDEIGDISPAVQVKLLRFLQEREFERVGGNQTIRVDVRIVAATNRDLAAAVESGAFREDLYYRLNVINVPMPPLRERPADVELLAEHFLRRLADENGKDVRGFDPEAMRALTAHAWPGNVRELENAVERAVVMARGELVTPADLPAAVRPADAAGGPPPIPGSTMAEIEKYAILQTLEATGGSTSRAAEILGLGVRTIQYRLQSYRSAPRSGAPAVETDEA